jgi:hypothetical protein
MDDDARENGYPSPMFARLAAVGRLVTPSPSSSSVGYWLPHARHTVCCADGATDRADRHHRIDVVNTGDHDAPLFTLFKATARCGDVIASASPFTRDGDVVDAATGIEADRSPLPTNRATASFAAADVAVAAQKASTNVQCWNEREIWRDTGCSDWDASARTYDVAAPGAIVHSGVRAWAT